MANQNIVDADFANFPTKTGNNAYSGTNTFENTTTFSAPILVFEVENPLWQNKTLVALTATANITAAQIIKGPITCNSGAGGATYTLPSAADIEAIIGEISNNRGKDILFINQDATGTATIAAGTNFNLNGCFLVAGNVTIPPLSQRRFDIVKIDGTPTFSLFG